MKADTVLTLTVVGGDTFNFSSYEVPESIAFGGAQKLAVHEQVGGRRTVDAMGAIERPLEWSGLMLGDNALSRARFLDTVRKSGKQCYVTWSELYYMAVIEDFRAQFERFYKIPYSIRLVVVQDMGLPVTAVANPGIDEMLQGDSTTAVSLGIPIADATLTGLLGTMDAAIKGVSSFAKATQSVINAVLGPVQAVQSRVNILIATVGNTAANVGTFGGVLQNNAVSSAAARLSSQAAASAQLPYLHNLRSVAGRMEKNLLSL